jgi:pimeloyl-ACP methyl ester carboxylesterase
MAGIFYGASFRDLVTSAFPAVNNQDVALGLIQGDRDGVVQPFSPENTYDQILNPPKALITVEGTNHYSLTNQDNLVRDPDRPTLDQEIAIKMIAR